MLQFSRFQGLFQKLGEPYKITNAQIKSSYQFLYDKLLDSYNNNDFHRINNLLDHSRNISIILDFKFPLSEIKSEEDTLLIDFVNLLYKIITIYPVKYFKTQLIATSFLNEFFVLNKEIPGLQLDWHPYYKVMKYYVLENESFFLRGNNLNKDKINVFGDNNSPTNFFELSFKISKYFTNTDTTKQLVKKFIPHISANGHYTPAYLSFLNALCPPHKGQYKLYIDYLLLELNDTTNYQCMQMILSIILQSIQVNIEDDFSFLIPTIKQLINTQIFKNKALSFPNRDLISYRFAPIHFEQQMVKLLPKTVIALFISPQTRKSILELLENVFVSFKSVCHPSTSSDMTLNIVYFIDFLDFSLRKSLRKIKKKKEKKFYFDMKAELAPSNDEIHKLLSMISQIRIMNIKNVNSFAPFLIDTVLDPSTIDHYLEVAFQCIDLTDAYGISKSGWTILTALITSIDKNEKIRDNFEAIFHVAVNNLYRPELQSVISQFLVACFLKVPFNSEKTVKGCEYFDYPRLAYSLFTNLISIFKSLPSVKGEISTLNDSFMCMILLFIISLFSNCSSEVMDEILPIFTSLAVDEDISNCVFIVESIIANYCYFSSSEQANKIAKAFQRQLKLQSSNQSMLRFLSIIYATSVICNSRTIESVKQVTDFLTKYTKSKEEEIRKIGWMAISHSLNIFTRIANVRVSLKEDKIKDNPLEIAHLNDFNISWETSPDTTDLSFEIFDPIFDQLLTSTDSHEINKLLNEVVDKISALIASIYIYSESSNQEDINEVLLDPIHYQPGIYRKSFPLRDKFIKCMLRILKDFHENDLIVIHVISICHSFFSSYSSITTPNSQERIHFLSYFFMPFEETKEHFTSNFLYNELAEVYKQRKLLYVIPLTDDIKELLNTIVGFISSKYENIQTSSLNLIKKVSLFYYPFTETIIEKIVNNASSIPINEFINFIEVTPVLKSLLNNEKLMSKTMLIILNNFNLKDKESLITLKRFMGNVCILSYPFETPQNNNTEYNELLNEIENNHINKNQNNRTYNYILIHIIFMCLKRVYAVNDTILSLIMQNITYYDEDISDVAELCLCIVLKRQSKFTKEKIEVKNFPTISSFPNILDNVTVKFNKDGLYFPLTLRTVSSKDVFEQIEAVEAIRTKSTNIINLNSIIEINEDVQKIFESFEKVEIKWNYDENYQLFDNEFLFDQSNGYFMYRDHFQHKKFEFHDDKILIKNIPNIFSSAMNSINEKTIYTNIRYHQIWEQYALTVGPYCIPQLHKISIKYLSQFFSMNPEITTKVLYDMISGFMKNICYWNVNDRIEFFKLVVLPVVCFISSNKTTARMAEYILTFSSMSINPYCFAPLIKALFELSPQGPNMPLNSRPLVSIISKQPSIRPFHFFNAIDQLKEKYVDPFIHQMSEYNSSIVNEIIQLIFSFLECCSFSNKKSPLYSSEIESKRETVLKIFEEILELNENNVNNEKLKRNLTRALTSSFICFNKSSHDARLLIAPLFVNHLHSIFNLLNSSNCNEEDQFIISTSAFIDNTIFIINVDLELNFVTCLIKEMMNSSLPMQLILLESINKMLEGNIFNIPQNHYSMYEELFLNYGRYEKAKNLGNELRLKIAKILGIFEIRDFTMNDNNLKDDDEVLKASSIILNSYLFDCVDERVTKAFDLMEECCVAKGVKNRDFMKSVSKIFINRHSDHVMNDVEELIIQYKNILTPSYIS